VDVIRGLESMSDQEVDVVVIGAGVAGLHAAGQLGLSGLSVALLEGRDRVGGRIWTAQTEDWPGPIELGAEFIHGGNPLLEKLMRSHRLSKRPVKEQHWFFEQGRRREIPDVWERIDSVMKKIGPTYTGSFGAWLKKRGHALSPADRKLAETFVTGFQGAPLGQMSAHTLFEATKEDEEQFRVMGGYGKLVDALTRRLPRKHVTLELRKVVQQIEWKRGAVIVHAGDQRWRASAVLITVPLGVLQAAPGAEGGIKFSPELGARRKLWRSVPKGHAVRVVLRMRGDIWRRGVVPAELRRRSGAAFGFLHSDESFFPVWWSEAPQPVLVGWTGGPSAQKLAGVPAKQIFERARKTLSKLLGCPEEKLSRSVVDWRTHDWATDPLTRGAYSFSVAGKEKIPQQIARPIERTLFFAGEATGDALELGTAHGAVSSGEGVAREIVGVLKRDLGTKQPRK
jgi:monoamine oxidase